MKKQIYPAIFLSSLILSGCVTTKAIPRESDFMGSLPDTQKAKFLKLNDLDPFRVSHRGNVMRYYHFDKDRSLLTIIDSLSQSRWKWSASPKSTWRDSRVTFCRDYKEALIDGLGVRIWLKGKGGFTTPIVTQDDCDKLNRIY